MTKLAGLVGVCRLYIWMFYLTLNENHFDRLERWLRLEADAEAERMATKLLTRDSKDAETSGETLLDLVVSDSDPGIGGRFLVTFIKRNREIKLPWNRLKVGSPVVVARFKTDESETYSGVVSKRQHETIQVSLNEMPDGESFRIDLAADQITHKRCSTALQTARQSRGRLGHMRRILLGEKSPEFANPQDIEIVASGLNASQQEAVQFGLAARDLAVIHGPPGTGKTTTVVELIIQAIERGDKVLACAPSNTAVDHLVLKLLARGQHPVRLGHPARVAADLQSRTLDSLAAQDPNMRVAKEMMRESAELFRKLDRYTRARPDRDWRRETRHEAKQLRQGARMMERQAVEHVLNRANLICATTTIDDSLLGERWFDLLVIDEACQSTEPPCWIPICRSEKVVFAGDHCQLPPTVISQQAASEGYNQSLMERLLIAHGDHVSRMLEIQYRMNEAIMRFSSDHFYDGQLTSEPVVAKHTIIEKYPDSELSELADAIKFVDTAGASWTEELEPGGESRRNPQEAEFLLARAKQLYERGVPLNDVAIIVPYAAQVRLTRELAQQLFGSEHRLEINTVDGFQGREKEIVMISLVRSNDKCEIGFLSDTRRMNVAMTRARRRLLIIGDSATIGGHDFYGKMLGYFESQGAYSSIWEYGIAQS